MQLTLPGIKIIPSLVERPAQRSHWLSMSMQMKTITMWDFLSKLIYILVEYVKCLDNLTCSMHKNNSMFYFILFAFLVTKCMQLAYSA